MLRLKRVRGIVREAAHRRRTLIPLGRPSKPIGSYELGQQFIHNQLNYRGLILFSIPHQRYLYDVGMQDYTIRDDELYMVLVDQRDVNSQESFMTMEIFKDVLANLRNVDGFDLVSTRNILPYNSIKNSGYGDFGTYTGFDFENYWYKKFIYDFDGYPKETGNLHKWRYDYFNYDSLKTYERTHWPEGIKVSISPVFLALNNKTQVIPKYGWKYHFKIELCAPGYYELIRHTFNWQGHEEDQISIDKGPGMYVGSDFAPNQKHHHKKKHILGIELSPEVPVFKFTSTKLLEYPAATFIGSLLFRDHRGREILVTLPSFNISIDSHIISPENMLQHITVTTQPMFDDNGDIKNLDELKKIDELESLSDLIFNEKHPKPSRPDNTIVSGVKMTGKKKTNKTEDDDENITK